MKPVVAATLLVAICAGGAFAAPSARDSCTSCHLDPEWFAEEAAALEASLADDVHAKAGLSCHDCHGGNPDPAHAGDFAKAMDPEHAAHPYRGAPERSDVPGFCGQCHSDPAYMRRFDPAARVDQVSEYQVSRHGIALGEGNGKVATCLDCHGGHGILRVKDPRSSVHPLRVPETCASCHADAAHMAGATRADGSPLPIDQYARWRRSVHAEALLVKGDLGAPTCNDCHGNHGAAPPGIDSLANVCGQCHGREATLFRQSEKRERFHTHNELFLSAADGDCGSCHEPPAPQAALPKLPRLAECATCHRNHAVVRPTIVSLLPLPAVPCVFCHEDPAPVEASAAEISEVKVHYQATLGRLLAESGGLEGDDLFDWSVERALELPVHHVGQDASGQAVQSPAFARLFERFRIGKTHFTFQDPETGAERRERVIACSDCHAAEPALGDGAGYAVAARQMQSMRELTSLTARAERILLRAQRGGVGVQEALLQLDRAVDAQIQLEALLHAFRTDPDSAFAGAHREGLEHARAALAGGRAGLEELGARRRGLAMALVLIALVLAGLGLRIWLPPDRAKH